MFCNLISLKGCYKVLRSYEYTTIKPLGSPTFIFRHSWVCMLSKPSPSMTPQKFYNKVFLRLFLCSPAVFISHTVDWPSCLCSPCFLTVTDALFSSVINLQHWGNRCPLHVQVMTTHHSSQIAGLRTFGLCCWFPRGRIKKMTLENSGICPQKI